MPIILAEKLTKKFSSPIRRPGFSGAIRNILVPEMKVKVAVDAIDLAIEEGEAVAYVGPNGAGKSTSIKMLTGILVPTAGTVLVNGIVPHKKRIENARNIGAVFGQRTQLWWDIPVAESFLLLKDIYEIPDATYHDNMERFGELLGLGEFMHLSARKISLGQRMRADLAAALLHNPRIVYLDEPTIGLDVVAKSRIREFIKRINAEQATTVLLTTHDLEDIEDICHRLVIIDRGKILYDGAFQEVKDTFARDRTMHFELRGRPVNLGSVMRDLGNAVLVDESNSGFSLRFDRFELSAGQVIGEVTKRMEVNDIRIDEPSIEEVIKRLYSGELKLPEKSRISR